MAKIKICGMRTADDIAIVNELVPDYAGFILTDGFKRTIDRATAAELKNMLDASIKAVGVFVDEPIDNVVDYYESGVIDIVQLHGKENVDYCKSISAPVIKVLKPADFDKISEYEEVVDYLLLDSGTGTGKSFDWSSIPRIDKPFFLAGGIDATNVELAIDKIKPYAVDMSSSVEIDGHKDYNKVKEVIEIVRRITNE